MDSRGQYLSPCYSLCLDYNRRQHLFRGKNLSPCCSICVDCSSVGVSRPGGSLDRRVNCRRVPQPRWVGARRSAKGGRQPEGDGRERWKSRGLRVCPAPRSGALAVGGYKRPRGRERAASRERLSRPSPRGQPSVRGP
jgi:hypothetical protein